jgi:hypothetical protein
VADDVNSRFGSERLPATQVNNMLQPADHERTLSTWKAVTEFEDPIWGWLVINFRDGGLQIFDGDGVFRAEAILRAKKVYWLPPHVADFAGDDEDEESSDNDDGDDNEEATNEQEAPKVATTQLDFFLESLKSAEYLQSLMDLVIRALDNLHSAPNSFSGEVSAVFGRPLALINMGWSLELATQPMKDQSTFSDNAKASPADNSVLDYDFTLRVGDKNNLRDGLIGYFTEPKPVVKKSIFRRGKSINETSNEINGTPKPVNGTNGISAKRDKGFSTRKTNGIRTTQEQDIKSLSPFDFSCLYTEFAEETESSDVASPALKFAQPLTTLRPYFINPVEGTPDDYNYLQSQVMSVFAAIVDPFSDISGYSMILPARKLQLSQWTIEKALKQMTPFMSVGPVLIPGDVPDSQLLQVARLGVSASDDTDAPAPTPEKKDDKDPPSIPAHIPGQGDWVWLQPVAVDDNAEDIQFLKINVNRQESQFQELDGPHTAIEGYMQLTTQPTPALVSNSKVHHPVNIGKFMGDSTLSLNIGGKGSCGGSPLEIVEVVISLERDPKKDSLEGGKRKKPDIVRKLNSYSILVDLPTEKTRLKEAYSTGKPISLIEPLCVTYTRPSLEYNLEITVIDEETGLTFRTQSQIPVATIDPKAAVSPATAPVSKRENILSASLSSLKLDEKIIAGKPFKGTLVLRDIRGNLCTDYDDREFINFDDLPGPQITFNSDSYSLLFPPIMEIGDKDIWVFILDSVVGDQPTKVHVLPDLSLDKCLVRGNGVCNGVANDQVKFELTLIDKKGDQVKDLDIKVSIHQGVTYCFQFIFV